LLSSNISSTCPHNMVNFGALAAEIDPVVCGTPADFNGFCVLAALLHGTPVLGVSQTAALNKGHHLYSTGRPSRWALARLTIYVAKSTFSRFLPAKTFCRIFFGQTYFACKKYFCHPSFFNGKKTFFSTCRQKPANPGIWKRSRCVVQKPRRAGSGLGLGLR